MNKIGKLREYMSEKELSRFLFFHGLKENDISNIECYKNIDDAKRKMNRENDENTNKFIIDDNEDVGENMYNAKNIEEVEFGRMSQRYVYFTDKREVLIIS